MAATLDQISGGRLDINVVPGGIQGDFERLGEVSDHAHRYARAEEFIAACRMLWKASEPVVFGGEHIRLNGAVCSPGPVGDGPQLYVGGASDTALDLAARQSDVYLAWIGPQEQIGGLLDKARVKFAAAGRPPVFGLRTHMVVRDTKDEAWAAADELLSQAESTVKAQRRATIAGTPMVGARLQAQPVEDHRLGPHLWNGISTVRVNCGTAIVGTPEQAATELLGYWRLGIDEFILSGFPHVEECRRIAADVLPVTKSLITEERNG